MEKQKTNARNKKAFTDKVSSNLDRLILQNLLAMIKTTSKQSVVDIYQNDKKVKMHQILI